MFPLGQYILDTIIAKKVLYTISKYMKTLTKKELVKWLVVNIPKVSHVSTLNSPNKTSK